MFWSDFHTIQFRPSGSVKTRGSIEPPWSSWQIIGSGWAVNGPVAEGEKALPMHSVGGTTPLTMAVK